MQVNNNNIIYMNAATLLQYTVSGLMPTITASLTGVYLAKSKIFTAYVVGKITATHTNCLIPMFSFFTIAGSVDFHDIQTIWPLFLSPLVMIILGRLISLLHYIMVKQVPYFSRIIACLITFPNMVNLPLVLMRGMCSNYGPLQGNKYCADADGYIGLQMLTFNGIVWGYGYSLMAQDKRDYLIFRENQLLLDGGMTLSPSQPFSI